jgi:hypothetical protein
MINIANQQQVPAFMLVLCWPFTFGYRTVAYFIPQHALNIDSSTLPCLMYVSFVEHFVCHKKSKMLVEQGPW